MTMFSIKVFTSGKESDTFVDILKKEMKKVIPMIYYKKRIPWLTRSGFELSSSAEYQPVKKHE